MTVQIVREPTGDPPMEHCCFCRVVTSFWTAISDREPGEQVACCEHCASRAFPEDVPSKRVWCRREAIANRPTIGQSAWGHDVVRRPDNDEIASYPRRTRRAG